MEECSLEESSTNYDNRDDDIVEEMQTCGNVNSSTEDSSGDDDDEEEGESDEDGGGGESSDDSMEEDVQPLKQDELRALTMMSPDMRVVVNGETFRFHKKLFNSVSKQFRRLLQQGKHLVKLDMGPGVFDLVRIFLYHDEIPPNLDTDRAFQVLRDIAPYGIASLEGRIEKHVETLLNVSNVVEVLGKSRELKNGQLEYASLKFIYGHPDSILNTDDFYKLSYKDARVVLTSDDLSCTEDQVYSAACRWAREKENRSANPKEEDYAFFLEKVLYCVRFPLMTPTQLALAFDTIPKSIYDPRDFYTCFHYVSLPESQREKSKVPLSTRFTKTKRTAGGSSDPQLECMDCDDDSGILEQSPDTTSTPAVHPTLSQTRNAFKYSRSFSTQTEHLTTTSTTPVACPATDYFPSHPGPSAFTFPVSPSSPLSIQAGPPTSNFPTPVASPAFSFTVSAPEEFPALSRTRFAPEGSPLSDSVFRTAEECVSSTIPTPEVSPSSSLALPATSSSTFFFSAPPVSPPSTMQASEASTPSVSALAGKPISEACTPSVSALAGKPASEASAPSISTLGEKLASEACTPSVSALGGKPASEACTPSVSTLGQKPASGVGPAEPRWRRRPRRVNEEKQPLETFATYESAIKRKYGKDNKDSITSIEIKFASLEFNSRPLRGLQDVQVDLKCEYFNKDNFLSFLREMNPHRFLPFSSKSGKPVEIEKYWAAKFNMLLKLNGVTFFKMCKTEEEIVMNYFRESGSPLFHPSVNIKRLAISNCQFFVEAIQNRGKSVESLTLYRVWGRFGMDDILATFPKLNELICWKHLVERSSAHDQLRLPLTLTFSAAFLARNHLRKLVLNWTEMVVGNDNCWETSVRELRLENCYASNDQFIASFPKIFPKLEKLMIVERDKDDGGNLAVPKLVHAVTKIRTVRWIRIDGLKWPKSSHPLSTFLDELQLPPKPRNFLLKMHEEMCKWEGDSYDLVDGLENTDEDGGYWTENDKLEFSWNNLNLFYQDVETFEDYFVNSPKFPVHTLSLR